MSVSIKRSVHIFVNVDASFKKKYILFLNHLIDELKQRLVTYSASSKVRSNEKDYVEFITQKKHETMLQVDQLKDQINKIKRAKVGSKFKLSTIDGFITIKPGDDLMSILSPLAIEIDDYKVSKISQ